MKLTVQPDDGAAPLLTAIARARTSIDIVIFRLDMREIVQALRAAVERGVCVRALVAHTNKGDEKGLRRLERDLLAIGVSVARTADDLVRYHGKMMIVDARAVHIQGFNFTRLDILKSRSFGIISTAPAIVQQARKLFEADCTRQSYAADHPRLVVSPANARKRLAAFIDGARRQLLIYDANVSDPRMLKLLADRQRQGVEVRIIGCIREGASLTAEDFPGKRLHVRCIIRDGRRAFLGSQSLRTLELDRRREIGVFVHEMPVVKRMLAVFEEDWMQTAAGRAAAALAEAHAAAQSAAAAAQTTAAEVPALSDRSEKAAQQALSEAERLAEQARDAAREAEEAARALVKAGDRAEALAAADEARTAARQARKAVKEAGSDADPERRKAGQKLAAASVG